MTLGPNSELVLEIQTCQQLSPALVESVTAFCDDVQDVPGARAVVISVAACQSGHDDSVWPGDVDVHLVSQWERALRRLEQLGLASIAVLTGHCGGPAIELMLACDYRIGVVDMVLDLPVGDGGIWPGMALYRLANRLGPARSRTVVLFEQSLDAERAAQLGLIDEVVAGHAEAAEAVKAKVGSSGGPATIDIVIRRRLLHDAASTTFEEALGAHLAACDRALRRARATVANGAG